MERKENMTTTTSSSASNQAPKPRGRRKKIRTEPIRPICPQCEKQFSNQSALTKHKLTHSDERKFACQQCSKAFKRHDHLTGHMQTHSNRKPFNCTIQGCDKTYCDARSLRRHKENIHHIVSPKDCNNNNGSGCSDGINDDINNDINNNNIIITNNSINQQSSIKTEQTSCITSTSTASGQQPSLLLRRRIQRLNSDPGGQFDRHLGDNHNQHHYIQTQQPNQPNQHLQLHEPQHQHHHHHHHQQHHHQQQQASSFSADYASTQHFFDFNQMTPMGQQYCAGGSMPHSANSITDSGLGLNIHYEQQLQQPMTPNVAHDSQRQHNHDNSSYLTPTTLHPPPTTPTFNTPHDQQQNYNPQTNGVAVVHHQPSQLSRKRIQRLCSDPGGPHEPARLPDPTTTCRPIETNRRSVDTINHNYHHQQAPYSADYASTQHFSFDFNHQMAPTTMDHGTGCSDGMNNDINNNNNNNNIITTTNNSINQQSSIKTEQTLCITSSTASSASGQQPSHLLRRRIQRLHSDPGGQLDEMPIGRLLDTDYKHLGDNNNQHHYSQTQQPNQHLQLQEPQQNHTQQHHHHQQQHHNQQQASSFSADYASTQHFFDSNQMNPMEQQYCTGGSMPHSANSINDSSLGLNVHYEQQLQQPMTPNLPHEIFPIETNRRSVDTINHHYHHQQAPYSADYASTQHFSFDFNHQMAPTSTTMDFDGSLSH